jgi:hypothetical protein
VLPARHPQSAYAHATMRAKRSVRSLSSADNRVRRLKVATGTPLYTNSFTAASGSPARRATSVPFAAKRYI